MITHEHLDHCKYIKDVVKRVTCPIYASEGTLDNFDIPNYKKYVLKNKEMTKIKGWQILPFDIQHDASEPFGYLIKSPSGERLLFATDTYYVRYVFNDLDYILVECNYSLPILQEQYETRKIDKKRYNRLLTSHFELDNVKAFLKAHQATWSKIKEIWLLHLSDNNSNAEQFKNEIQLLTGSVVYIAGDDKQERW